MIYLFKHKNTIKETLKTSLAYNNKIEFIYIKFNYNLRDFLNNLYAYNQIDENKTTNIASDGYLQGAVLMSLTTLFWSIYHIVIKYVYTMNPGVN